MKRSRSSEEQIIAILKEHETDSGFGALPQASVNRTGGSSVVYAAYSMCVHIQFIPQATPSLCPFFSLIHWNRRKIPFYHGPLHRRGSKC
jgi:hypothetical protein